MLALEHLERRYDGSGGVTDVSIHLPRGAVYVLCGANGAGKTTTIAVLAGLLFSRKGTLRLADRHGATREVPLHRYVPRPGFGYVPDQPVLDPHLTPWQWLAFASGIKDVPVRPEEAEALAQELALDAAVLGARISSLSFGNQRKVALWAEMATTRELLVLDEPLIGLDPFAIRAFERAAQAFAAGGRGVLLSTHLLAEAETMATHVGVIHQGRTVREGTLEAVREGGTLREAFLELAAP